MPCSYKVQLKNEYEQLYNVEKQANARLMEEIKQLKEALAHEVCRHFYLTIAIYGTN